MLIIYYNFLENIYCCGIINMIGGRKMKSLFITTSTKLASISLYDDKGMLANINVNVKKTHSTW